jgi:DNA replication protein DnaC
MSKIEEALSELKILGIKQSIEYRLAEARSSDIDIEDFLYLILEDEKIYRTNRRSERLRKKAKFNNSVSLDEFEATVERGINKMMLKKLRSLDFLEKNENLIFTGGTGTGKSYLAQSVGQLCCLYGYETLFLPVNRMFKEIQAAEASGEYIKYINRLSRAKVLIFDDFGLRNYTHTEATILYDICEQKYQKSTIVITSQVKPQGWKSLFEDDVVAEAILDRLESCAHHINLKGPSYRKKHEPKKDIGKQEKLL